jgi:hypothetical protein
MQVQNVSLGLPQSIVSGNLVSVRFPRILFHLQALQITTVMSPFSLIIHMEQGDSMELQVKTVLKFYLVY